MYSVRSAKLIIRLNPEPGVRLHGVVRKKTFFSKYLSHLKIFQIQFPHINPTNRLSLCQMSPVFRKPITKFELHEGYAKML